MKFCKKFNTGNAMNKTLKMGFVAAFTVFTLAIMSAQAGGEAPPIKGGIADLRYIKTKMTVNLSASNNTTARNADEGSATTGDTTTGTTSGEVSTAGTATCDFSGFAQNDVVNNAYAGGASLTGVVKPNIHIGYFDARALNAYFGANEPNPGIAYTNTGSILVSLQNITATNFAFSYTCAVKLTVRTFSSVDGSGTALNTYTLAKNLPGTMGPYNVWTNFSQPIDTTVRSISISGDAARWGMDQVVVTNSCATSSPARKVAVFMNSAFIQTCTSYDCEGTNTVNMLTSLGYNVTTFSGITAADWTQQFNDKRIIVIPEQEVGQIASSLDGASRLALANGVASGGSVLVFGAYNSNAESLLNIAGSLSLSHSTNNPSGPVGLNSANVAGTPFVSGPSIISWADGTYTNKGWPSSSVIAYGSTSAVWVASATTGLGQVGFVAYDYYNPSGQSASGNWTLVVDKMIQQLSATDCNSNGIDDICEIDSGQVADIDGNHVPDTCQTDCNGNGKPDAWEISTGLVRDCNVNGIPDSCDITPDGSKPVAQSRNGILVTDGGTVNTAFTGLPIAAGDVSMTFTVNADINNGGSSEFVMFTATGSPISVTITGTQCGTEVRTISVPVATYNAALVGGTLGFAIKTGPNTGSFCSNTWKIDLAYSGGERDCDGNGVIDRCEIADGSAVDQNGNGVPDSCDPFPVLRLTTNAAACNTVGSTVTVDATLSGVLNNVVAGQILLTWDVSKLSFAAVLPGDAPYTTAYALNEQAGTIMILASTTAGGTGTTAASAVVSRIQFTVIGGSCSGTGNEVDFFTFGPMGTEFTDGYGGATVPTLLASAGFVVDDGAPVLSNVPANVTVQAEAGMGSFANVALTPPTATDACAPGLTSSSSRSDGASLGAAFPVGTTTVTWSATDPCGNVTFATTTVTVNNYNTSEFVVSYDGGYPASSSRNFALDIHGDNGNNARSTSAMFAAGTASFSITDLAIANYDCVSIRDIGHSLRRRVAMSVVGTDWSATATLIAGDLNGNDVIDVVDWGMYIVGNSNADLDGNSVINSTDGAIIITNFGKQSDAVCGGALMGPPEPISAISVAELVDRGLTDLIGADLNNDGWLDMEDVRLAN